MSCRRYEIFREIVKQYTHSTRTVPDSQCSFVSFKLLSFKNYCSDGILPQEKSCSFWCKELHCAFHMRKF